MTPDLQFVKQILESKLHQLANSAAWRDSIEVRHSADLADTTQQAVEREIASRDLDRNVTLAREVRAALDRIADGSYGSCVKCDEPIALKRITAVPWTALCLSCQEEEEAARLPEEKLAA